MNIDRDIPFCGGNCLNEQPSIPDQVRDSFSNSSDFKAVVVPSAGHGLNLVSRPRIPHRHQRRKLMLGHSY